MSSSPNVQTTKHNLSTSSSKNVNNNKKVRSGATASIHISGTSAGAHAPAQSGTQSNESECKVSKNAKRKERIRNAIVLPTADSSAMTNYQGSPMSPPPGYPLSPIAGYQYPLSPPAGHQHPLSPPAGHQHPLYSPAGHRHPLSRPARHQHPLSLPAGYQQPKMFSPNSPHSPGQPGFNPFGYQSAGITKRTVQVSNFSPTGNIVYRQNIQYVQNTNKSQNIQNMAARQQCGSPHYYNNLMQHPLLQLNYMNSPNFMNLTPNQSQALLALTLVPSQSPAIPHRDSNRFEPYLSLEEVKKGLKNKELFQGVLRINPKQFRNAFVTTDRNEQDILIDGLTNRNRSFEGDVVVIKILDNATVEAQKTQEKKAQAKKQSAKNKNVKTPQKTCTKQLNFEEKPADAKDQPKATATLEELCQDKIKELKLICEPQKQEISTETQDAEDAEPKLLQIHTDSKKQQRYGMVVYIMEKVHPRTCVGYLKLMGDKNKTMASFTPRDSRCPLLNIPCTSWPDDFYKKAKSYENILFLAKILDWYDTRFAIGIIDSILGRSGDLVAEQKAILLQNDLEDIPFDPSMKKYYPDLDYIISPEEINLREDCRKLCVFAIDPYNCRDIDDAVSCRELENGNYEIGVHISDVSHYLAEKTELDEKVAKKATTIYLVERAYHMLPDDLCLLCSLFPGKDKLTFSVFWEITKDAKVLSHRFNKSVIHSCAQLSYEHAQAILDDKVDEDDFPEIHNGFTHENIYKSVRILDKVATILRKNRFHEGALKIDQPKISFRLDEKGLPKSFCIYECKESNKLIEEFMLLANTTVAIRIYEDHPELAYLRCHPAPSPFMMKSLMKSLKTMGINLDTTSSYSLQDCISDICKEDFGKGLVLSVLCSKPMSRAKYFCAGVPEPEGMEHFALNIPLYTHFTSPIRRYSDIMVHRLLAASLRCRALPGWEPRAVAAVADRCNKNKYNAKRAYEMSSELYTLKYIEMFSPVVTQAVVLEVKDTCLDIFVFGMALTRRVYFNKGIGGKYTFQRNAECRLLSKVEVVWEKTETLPEQNQVLEIFKMVTVCMKGTDDCGKIDVQILRPQQIDVQILRPQQIDVQILRPQ